MDYANETNFANIKAWVNREATKLIEEEVASKTYSVTEGQIWATTICEKILKFLAAHNKNFKFIVNSLVMQKADCGLNISGSCYWDNEVDGSVTIRLDYASFVSITNIFACAI
ncbi:dynein light chain Tctex-type-like [Hippocampus zosterae]|uniref:dynein light chain Tctex-type-like n=1 Tax=Hippocampus zosterae TaxID=109293 RepID=UPI00223CC1FF|nr:dynein light chain Tctex-type-like [Hippocampus zosterae]